MVIAVIGILSGLIVVSMSGTNQKATIAKSQIFSSTLRNYLLLNLISEWKLDGNVNDSWKTNNGTWSGPTGTNTSANYRSSTECVFDQCLDFDGTDDIITIPNLDFKNKLTVCAWAKFTKSSPSSLVGNWQNGGPGDEFLLTLYTSSTVYWFVRGDNGTSGFSINDEAVAAQNVWYYLCGSFNSGSTRLFRDGKRVGNGTASFATLYDNTQNIFIGKFNGSNFHKGLIDEVRIYDEDVPISQIKEQYYLGLNNLLVNGAITKEEYLSKINNSLAIKY